MAGNRKSRKPKGRDNYSFIVARVQSLMNKYKYKTIFMMGTPFAGMEETGLKETLSDKTILALLTKQTPENAVNLASSFTKCLTELYWKAKRDWTGVFVYLYEEDGEVMMDARCRYLENYNQAEAGYASRNFMHDHDGSHGDKALGYLWLIVPAKITTHDPIDILEELEDFFEDHDVFDVEHLRTLHAERPLDKIGFEDGDLTEQQVRLMKETGDIPQDANIKTVESEIIHI